MSIRAIWYAVRVLVSGKLTEGVWVKRFEQEFKKMFLVPNAVAVNSGTSGLELAYHLAGITKGDEVIVPVLTCAATNVPLKRLGAKIIFADVDFDLNINIEDVKRKITKKTKAVVFVHFGGNNRGLFELIRLGQEHGFKVIEDAAQAIGSNSWGLADYASVSLQAIKTLTAVDGGVLVCKSDEDAQRARRLRWFGIDRQAKQKTGDVDFTEAGWKFHMNNLNAAIALGNLYSINKVINRRYALKEIFESYGLLWNPWLVIGFGDVPSVVKTFADNNIEVGQHHYRNDKYTVFGGRQKLGVMDALENSYFFVPSHHDISKRTAHKIGRIYKCIQNQI